MVGGTNFHRKVIRGEISRVLVLSPLPKITAASQRQDSYALDNAFALIEGHPHFSFPEFSR